MGVCLSAVLLSRARVRLGLVVLAGIVVMSGLAMVMRSRLVVGSSVMMMLAGCVLGRCSHVLLLRFWSPKAS